MTETDEIRPGLQHRNPMRLSPRDRRIQQEEELSRKREGTGPEPDSDQEKNGTIPSLNRSVVRLTDDELEVLKIILRADMANRHRASVVWREKADPLAKRLLKAGEVWITREPAPPF